MSESKETKMYPLFEQAHFCDECLTWTGSDAQCDHKTIVIVDSYVCVTCDTHLLKENTKTHVCECTTCGEYTHNWKECPERE